MPGQIVPLTLTARSNKARIRQFGQASLMNAIPELTGEDAASAMPVYCREGLKTRAVLAGGPIRGAFEVDSASALFLSGVNLYRMSSSYNALKVGQIPGTGSTRFARNRRSTPQIAAVTDGVAYVVEGSSIKPLNIPSADTGYIQPIDCAFINGYIVFVTRSGQMHWTNIDNAFSVSALNYATAEGNPDGLWRCINRKLELWLFGDRTVEVWSTTGDFLAPFRRLGGGFLEVGILAPDSLVMIDDRLVWLNDKGIISKVEGGYQAQRISTHYVEQVIQAEPKELRASIRAQTYTVEGHQHYVLSGSTFSLDYDFSTGAWLDRETESMSRWRADHAISAFGTSLAGDIETGNVYEIRTDEPNDGDRPIVMRVTLPPVMSDRSPLVFYDVSAQIATGAGSRKAGAPSVDAQPTVRLRWTDDGGDTWSGYRTQPLGAHGAGVRRVTFNNLGQSGQVGRTFEFSMSAAVDRGIAAVSARLAQVTNP